LDRFKFRLAQTSKLTVQQNAAAVTPPVGFLNYLGVTSTSSYTVLAGDFFVFIQDIEGFNTSDLGFGTALAATVTLSFRVYSSLTGTFSGALRNSAANRSYPFNYSVSTANTWTTISVTISGDTSGTWIGATNGIGLSVIFNLGCGSTFSSTANSWQTGNYTAVTGSVSVVGTNGATFYITGVQLEKGSTATSFDYRPYGTELALCQRYFEITKYEASANDFCVISTPQTTSGVGTYIFKATKRASPTGAYSALADLTCFGSGYASIATTALNFTSFTNYSSLNPTVASGFLAQGSAFIRITGTSGYVSFSAEL
jgi:hypothetical protein